jgi:hypothetical protein
VKTWPANRNIQWTTAIGSAKPVTSTVLDISCCVLDTALLLLLHGKTHMPLLRDNTRSTGTTQPCRLRDKVRSTGSACESLCTLTCSTISAAIPAACKASPTTVYLSKSRKQKWREAQTVSTNLLPTQQPVGCIQTHLHQRCCREAVSYTAAAGTAGLTTSKGGLPTVA